MGALHFHLRCYPVLPAPTAMAGNSGVGGNQYHGDGEVGQRVRVGSQPRKPREAIELTGKIHANPLLQQETKVHQCYESKYPESWVSGGEIR